MSEADHQLVRLAHLSDVHVTTSAYSWRREDWLNKRLAAWLNLRLLGRGFRFRKADKVLASLHGELQQRQCDHLIFSGDATALGFEEEIARAADLLGVAHLRGLAVPGNHDYCTRSAMLGCHFEKHFAPWQQGERIDHEPYPFAQRIGSLWLVAVNSATANRWAWDARGAVGESQLIRLEKLLSRLDGGPRILVTHYPVALASGRSERKVRGLRDLNELLGVASEGGIGLWLHGHRHNSYHLVRDDLAPFPIICAGSATQTGHWSYGEYTIRGSQMRGIQRVFNDSTGLFRDGRSFELEIRCPNLPQANRLATSRPVL